MEAGLYHGTELLCQTQRTQDAGVAEGRCSWTQDLCFQMTVQDIPRASRICLVLYEVTRAAKSQRARRRLGPVSQRERTLMR